MRVVGLVGVARFCLGLAAMVAASETRAAETNFSNFQGSWLAQGLSCAEVYSAAGKGTSFKKPLDIFAQAFIVSGSRLRTPMASCRVKSVKANKDRQRIVLDCTNAIAGNEVAVSMQT